MKKLLLLAGLTAALSAVQAGPGRADEPRQISVSGEGQVEAAPDMATIVLGVTQDAGDAGTAMRATSQAVAQVLDRLTGFGIQPRDIQTQRLTLNPVWSNQSSSSPDPARITGFVASNAIVVRVRELDELGAVLDAVIDAGANDFNGLTFSVQDPDALIEKARAGAVADAIAKAGQLAAAAGVALGPVQSITEHGMGRPQPRMMEMAAARGGGVPVAGGEVTLSVSVAMVFAIGE
ncbi:MAG: SIMPL domain-containing protein [Jhaorihella sp.]